MTDFKADFKAIATALDKRGFCVVPEFLSRDEIDFLVAQFDASPDYSPPTKTRHAERHLGDKPVAGQTGALRATAMGRRETFQGIGPQIEEFARGVTGAKAALYQILYLQRVVNGGGRIEREYGLGRGRTDLLIVWPHGGRERRFVVECKLLHRSLEHTIR